VVEAVVYGVAVPGAEGRAGMALLGVEGGLDLVALARRLRALPDYARPVFLRMRRTIETTATFKHKRHDLVEEGFDPARVADPLYVFDRAQDAYVRLDGERFARVHSGAMRL
jgi:fatty-acyl-CoA synthase